MAARKGVVEYYEMRQALAAMGYFEEDESSLLFIDQDVQYSEFVNSLGPTLQEMEERILRGNRQRRKAAARVAAASGATTTTTTSSSSDDVKRMLEREKLGRRAAKEDKIRRQREREAGIASRSGGTKDQRNQARKLLGIKTDDVPVQTTVASDSSRGGRSGGVQDRTTTRRSRESSTSTSGSGAPAVTTPLPAAAAPEKRVKRAPPPQPPSPQPAN